VSSNLRNNCSRNTRSPRVTTKDLLAHLLTGDRQATTDALLHALSDGDDDDDDDGNGDDGEFEDGLHNDDVEDDDDDDDDE
jgi:hypothetical protein